MVVVLVIWAKTGATLPARSAAGQWEEAGLLHIGAYCSQACLKALVERAGAFKSKGQTREQVWWENKDVKTGL